MKITMIGAGYVGLVSGVCFADFGHDVVCLDKDESKIDALMQGLRSSNPASTNWSPATSPRAACHLRPISLPPSPTAT